MIRWNRASGFTLVEVLVGLTIFGMMTLLLMSSLSTLTIGARSGEARFDQVDDDRLIRAFLRRQIENAYAMTRTDGTVVFDGRSDELQFIGHLPAHRGGGGVQLLKLSLEQADNAQTLVLATRTAWRNETYAALEKWQAYPMVRNVSSIRFDYFGSRRGEDQARWGDTWSEAEHLPDLVRIDLNVSGRPPWPSLVIAIRARTAEAQPHLLLDSPSEGA